MKDCATCCLMTRCKQSRRQQRRRWTCACEHAALDMVMHMLLPGTAGAQQGSSSPESRRCSCVCNCSAHVNGTT